MAPVVNGKSDLIHDYLDPASRQVDPVQARGRLIVATGTVANTATDSAGSKYHLADLPSDCILDEGTKFGVAALGFAQVVIGTKTDIDALVYQTKATEPVVTPVDFGGAQHGRRLWETLGLAADPGGLIGLWLHAEAAATGAGSMPFVIKYIAH